MSFALVDFARSLIDIDSTTGRESECVRAVERELRRLGYRVERQAVEGDRANLFAWDEPPAVVFSTHMDCVPPHIASSERGGRLYGRGSCDAKGILAAQLAAAERLRGAGRRDVGLLFVVGEERGSDGAQAARAWRPQPPARYLIDGEPTENKLVSATKGVLRLKLVAKGRAMHSSFPELGESAIEKLVDALTTLRTVEWPSDPEFGATNYSVGLISGGVAPNVVPAHAEAEVLFRIVGESAPVRDAARRAIPSIDVQDVLEVPPVKFVTIDGFETAVFPFTTDSPFLSEWGKLMLMGPGDPRVAHTDGEHVEIAELHRAVDLYERLAIECASR